MKSKIIIALGIFMCITGTIIAATNLDPGSASDPLVTKSYVDSVVQSGSGSSAGFESIPVEKGTTIIGHASTEIILRSGEATIVGFKDPATGIENGVPDTTDGVDLKSGSKCPQNHLLIVPRYNTTTGDERGIKVTSDGVYVMIKGSYDTK